MIPRLVVLTDRAQLRGGRSLAQTVRDCASVGLRAVMVREHDLAPEARRELVTQLCEVEGLRVISSRVPGPATVGLHLSADQPAPAAGPWGRSCHSAEEAHRAEDEGADWVTLSPYAVSVSKPGHLPPLPASEFAVDVGIPVLALGGITPGNAASALEAGADGVAVMGAVMGADEPAVVVSHLLEVVR